MNSKPNIDLGFSHGVAVFAGHVAGWAASSFGLAAAILGGNPLGFARNAFGAEPLIQMQLPHAAGHLLLGGLFWVALFMLGRAAWSALRPAAPRRVVKLARGTALIETLVVLPVALLLYLGLAQLAINNIAVALTNLATFQAARSVWVWMPEANGGRRSATAALAADKARVQAAMALTPVAAGDYIMSFNGLSSSAQEARSGLLAAQFPFIADDQGALATDTVMAGLQVEDVGGLLRLHTRGNQTVPGALDRSSFRLRTIRKFTFAYLCTSVIPISTGGRVGARLNYLHFNSMPLVGNVFGTLTTVGGRTGHYTSIRRELTLPEQFNANPAMP